MDIEKLGMKKKELDERESTLVQKLRAVETDNKLVAKIIQSVEYGFLEAAKRLCWNESDKFRQDPEVIDILIQYLFDEDEEKPWRSTARPK